MKLVIMVAFGSWLISTLLGPWVIRLLTIEKVDQTEREEGPQSHKKKAGTPTMGGWIFLLPVLLLSLIYAKVKQNATIPAVLSITFGFGLIGFIDDYIKVVKHRNLGLRAWQKLLGEFLASFLFIFILGQFAGINYADMMLPFFSDHAINFGRLSILVLMFIALATSNGTNFTDGVDGLCASVTAVIAAFFVLVAWREGRMDAAFLSAAFFGSLLGYLFFNVYPGKVMMGDTGSLAIGGFVTGMAYALQIPLLIPFFGIIYALEVISVIMQVTYFKATHGKRIFKMAPIHHHFELSGWSETRVVNAFTTVTILGCMFAYWALL